MMPVSGGIRKRLSDGLVRTLTPSEVARGYIFISTDRELPEILDVQDFEVSINGKVFPSRSINASGRVYISRAFLKLTVGKKARIQIRVEAKKKVSMDIINS